MRRTEGEKENISNAKWLLHSMNGGENDIGVVCLASPVKKGAIGEDTNALLVPRKRTNANHLITPKKASRKLPLLDVTPGKPTVLEIQERLAPSANEPASLEKKHSRRTKSMRKSSRFSSIGAGDGDFLTADGSVETSLESSAPMETSSFEFVRGHLTQESTSQEPVSSQPVDIFGTSSEVVIGAASNVEVIIVELEEPSLGVEEMTAIPEAQEPEDGMSDPHKTEILPMINEEPAAVPNGLRTLPKEASTAEDSTAAQQNSNISPVIEEENVDEEPVHAGNEILGDAQAQFVSDETSITTNSLVAIKTGDTPKQKRASSRNSRTPRLSPAKRSARVTRSSYLLPDSSSPQTIQRNVENGGSLGQVRSPCNSKRTPQRRISNAVPLVPNQAADRLQEPKTSLKEVANTLISIDASNLEFEVPQVPSPVLEEQAMQSSEMDHIQQALNLEATESLDFDLPPPAYETSQATDVDVDAKLLIENASYPAFDRNTPELPEQSLAWHSVALPDLGNPNHDLSSDDISEASQNLAEFETITFRLEQPVETLPEKSTENLAGPLSSTESLESTSEGVSISATLDADTDLLRNFLTRVKAGKAAKASTSVPKRKRSLPHSPIQLPLGTAPAVSSPSSPKVNDDNEKDELDLSLPQSSPNKRRKTKQTTPDEDNTLTLQPRTTRRSGRTRLPVKSAPLIAPSFIPLRRQGGDNTVKLQRNVEKELATLTKFNTNNNKAGALLPPIFLSRIAVEKEDPAAKHKALQEKFDEKAVAKCKNKKGRNVVWAEELAVFQTLKSDVETQQESILPQLKEEREKKVVEKKPAPIESEQQKAVKVGVRSKISLGMAMNGTPGPKPKRQLKPRKK